MMKVKFSIDSEFRLWKKWSTRHYTIKIYETDIEILVLFRYKNIGIILSAISENQDELKEDMEFVLGMLGQKSGRKWLRNVMREKKVL